MKKVFNQLGFASSILLLLVAIALIAIYVTTSLSGSRIATLQSEMGMLHAMQQHLQKADHTVRRSLTSDQNTPSFQAYLTEGSQLKKLIIHGGINDNDETLKGARKEVRPLANELDSGWMKMSRTLQAMADMRLLTENKAQVMQMAGDSSLVSFEKTERSLNGEVMKKWDKLEESQVRLSALTGKWLETDRAAIQSTITNRNRIIGGIILLAFVFLAGNVYLFRSRIVKPIKELTQMLEKMTLGILNYDKINLPDNEIGQLADNMGKVRNRMKEFTEFAFQIGEGTFTSSFSASSEHDELGQSLINMRDSLVKVAAEDKKRNWATEGFAEFGEILRKYTDDLTTLADVVVGNLVKYLGANQGSIFVMEEHDGQEVMSMKGCYAYGRKKYMDMKVAVGEGLLGQAALEKDVIFITEVPQDYVRITSGLGESTPSCVLISPLIINDEVFGALEIASFRVFDQHEIEFVRKLSESIASSISSVRISENTKRLLEESQELTEQMQANEEEMRQNMEELQATHEEMSRIQRSLQNEKQEQEKFVTLIENSNDFIGIADLEGRTQYINSTGMKVVGVSTEEEARALSMADMVTEEEAVRLRNEIIPKVMAEGYCSYESMLVNRKANKTVPVEATVILLKNKETGEPFGIATVQRDISEKKRFEEDMRAAEEEMIQNMREMRSVQEEMQIFQEELQSQKLEQDKFVTLIENSQDFIAIANPEARCLFINKAGREMVGATSAEEVKDAGLASFFHMDEIPAFNDIHLKKVLEGESVQFESILHNKANNTHIPVETALFPLKKESGDIYAIAAVQRDMSQHKAQEEQLKEHLEEMAAQEEELRQNMEEMQATQEEMEKVYRELQHQKGEQDKFVSLVENSRDFVGIATMEGDMVFLNKAGHELIGMKEGTNINEVHMSAFFSKEEFDLVMSDIMPTVIKDGFMRYESTLTHQETGEKIDVEATVFVLRDPDSQEPVAIASLQRDIREQKRYQEEMDLHMDQLQAQEKMMVDTVKNMTQAQEEMRAIQQSLESQKAEQDKFVDLVENSTDFIALMDMDGKIDFINAAAKKLMGKKEVGEFSAFFAKQDSELVRTTHIKEALDKGSVTFEAMLNTGGAGSLVSVLLFVLKDRKTNEPVSLATIQRVITTESVK
ncbi:PAS domain S-box protein [Roseivirga sp. BDSF3-8]|uniref:PAS domain S-box protein n=1 Tax=Roseivirga sp. BDSF3-8 TaxID=3241598 RepID=UPI003532591B